ncbi:MAG: ABC transporter ATP-binding protein [Candidatus Dadabacteria bacterium]|nr:MAG: ABC transporter ATP-binding protein [Candidatus Dadabacteria bacterium]
MSHTVIVEHVSKVYRQGELDVPALTDISLVIDAGGFVSLHGPSGSGKTTLLNIIGGLDRPTAGDVIVAGKSLNSLSRSELAELRLDRIGFVFQSYNLIPVLSALENVEFIMQLQGVPDDERRERAMAVLKEVGLGGMEKRRPAQLSGGQQQRVAVARAIVSNPDIVLADEPTANLDSKTSAKLLELMQKMNQERGVTFVFSTHDPLVMKYARRLIALSDGRVVDDQSAGK